MSSYIYLLWSIIIIDLLDNESTINGRECSQLTHKKAPVISGGQFTHCEQRKEEIKTARKRIAELHEEILVVKKARTQLELDLKRVLEEVEQLKGI